jgi:alpha/beta superfamily hydrolase
VAFRLHRDARLVHFASADGVRLEGRLTVVSPERGAAPDPGGAQGRATAPGRGVVLCHPHPLYGGSMLSPVVLTAEQAFREAGWSTLAFNFRGVGGSSGTFDEGRAEQGDVAGALAYLAEVLGDQLTRPAVAGYSFGSWVGGQVAATDPRVGFYLGIAPVLNLREFGFLQAARFRLALIGAARDEFCDGDRLEALAASVDGAWVRVLDTDHFFTGALDDLATACRDALAWAE